jgi:hypothetical protein
MIGKHLTTFERAIKISAISYLLIIDFALSRGALPHDVWRYISRTRIFSIEY